MKLDIKQPVLDYEGKPIMVNKTDSTGSVVIDEHNKIVQVAQTLREYIVTALNNTVQGEVFTAEDKNKIYMLSNKLYSVDKEADLTLDDRQFIKERVGVVYSPLIYGRISELLEKEKS